MSLKRTIQLNVNCGSALSGHLLTGSLVDALVYLCYYIIYCDGLRLSSGSLLGSGISLCCWLYSVFGCGLCSGLLSSLGSLSRSSLNFSSLASLNLNGLFRLCCYRLSYCRPGRLYCGLRLCGSRGRGFLLSWHDHNSFQLSHGAAA